MILSHLQRKFLPFIITSILVIVSTRIFAFDEDKFTLGKSFFDKPWVSFPASTTARDGLGPLFNENACFVCHPKGGRSHKIVVKLDNPHSIYGTQINTKSNSNVPAEAQVIIDYKRHTVTYANGGKVLLKKPVVLLKKLAYGKVDSELLMRVAPSLFGLGLLEKVTNKPINRFNLSANEPSILAQVANAAHHDMGLTNPLYPHENCATQQVKCHQASTSDGLDLPMHRLKAITYFVQSLDKVSAVKPIKLFAKVGCSSCHTPSYNLKKRTIYPYSDLLAHNLGEGNFRTAPLWNSKKAPNFWHDGRAKTVEEAILWHQGEASLVRKNFIKLSPEDKKKLIQFIEKM